MEQEVRNRLVQLRQARDQFLANLNAANGAIAELERLIQLGETQAAEEAAKVPEVKEKKRRGPRPGTKRNKKAEELANGASTTALIAGGA